MTDRRQTRLVSNPTRYNPLKLQYLSTIRVSAGASQKGNGSLDHAKILERVRKLTLAQLLACIKDHEKPNLHVHAV